MGDLEDRLREALRQRAADVPPRLEVPNAMVLRARWRIARNILGALTAVAIVAVGTVTAIHALNGPGRQVPVNSPTPASCPAYALTGESRLRGNGFAREGSLIVKNSGRTPCTVEGRPTVTVIDQGTSIGLRNMAADPWWKVNGKASPGRMITLVPGQSARVRIVWSSWCGLPKALESWQWQIELPGTRDSLRLAIATDKDIPTCVDNRSSVLEVGPFEP